MAEIRSIYTDKRKNSDRRQTTYVEGAAVRKLQTREAQEDRRQRERRHSGASRQAVHGARREKQVSMGLGYTLFLTAACGLILWTCAGYLRLQADNTARSKNIASLEAQLDDLQTENDDEYNRVTTSVDLESIRDIAVNELGMVYAGEDQVVMYDSEGSDYVKQYAEIPEEESGLKELLGTISR